MHRSPHLHAVIEGVGKSVLAIKHLEAMCALLFTLAQSQILPELQSQLATRLMTLATVDWLKQATLRDTCIVINALHAYSKELPTGDQLAIVLEQLVKNEQKPGGPYGTPADISTNIAIAIFGSWAAGGLPEVEQYIHAHLARSHTATSAFNSLYLAALGAQATARQEAREYLAPYTKPGQATPPHSQHGQFLLSLYVVSQAEARNKNAQAIAVNNLIVEALRLELSQNAEPLKQQGAHLFKRLLAADTDFEISLLPYYFQQSMRQPTGSKQQLIQLGVANVYTWLAYMTYDGILDGHTGKQFLSFANVAQRQALWHYQQVVKDYFAVVRQIFTMVDQANAWEMQEAQCAVNGDSITITTVPTYATCSQLANRSMAHVCGPLYLAYLHSGRNQRYELLASAFRHYIIAKQLNDDMHDWQQDIQNGSLTYVVSALLRAMQIRPGRYSTQELIGGMRQVFWDSQGSYVAQHVQHHTMRARQFFEASQYVTGSNIIFDMLARLENIAQQAQVVRTRGASFMQQLEGSPLCSKLSGHPKQK